MLKLFQRWIFRGSTVTPSKRADWYSRFSFMIGDTHLSDGQKFAYLQGLMIEKAKTAIEGFACNGHLCKDAINE